SLPCCQLRAAIRLNLSVRPMVRLSLLFAILLSSVASASEPYTPDSGSLCINPPTDDSWSEYSISFDAYPAMEFLGNELFAVGLSRSNSYDVVLRRGDTLAKSFRLDFSDYPSGNVCLSYQPSNRIWILSPAPSGRTCICNSIK